MLYKVYKVHTSVEPQKRLVEHFLITITFIFFLRITCSKMNENHIFLFMISFVLIRFVICIIDLENNNRYEILP